MSNSKGPRCRIVPFPKEHRSQQANNDIHEMVIVAEHVKGVASQMLETAKAMDEALHKALEIVEQYTKMEADLIAKQDFNKLPN